MKNHLDHALIEAERKIVKHWTIFAGAAYALIAVGLLALALTSGSYAESDNPTGAVSYHDMDGFAAPVLQPNRLNQPRSSVATESTTGFNARWDPAVMPTRPASPAPEAAARPVLVPEVNEYAGLAKAQEPMVENGYDFTDPNGVPGFGPMPQSTMTSAAAPHLTAQSHH
jgi:hypothetical protein